MDPQPGENIIDCCAAPGGKTIFMASCLSGQGNVPVKTRVKISVSIDVTVIVYSYIGKYWRIFW